MTKVGSLFCTRISWIKNETGGARSGDGARGGRDGSGVCFLALSTRFFDWEMENVVSSRSVGHYLNQQKDKNQCMNKLGYVRNLGTSDCLRTDLLQLKKIFVLYIFVRKFTGSGWDDVEHHVTATKDYIEDFLKVCRNTHSLLSSCLLDSRKRLRSLFYYGLSLLD